MAQAAIRWVLDDPAHDSICLGAKNLTDYEGAMKTLELPELGEEFYKKLRERAGALIA